MTEAPGVLVMNSGSSSLKMTDLPSGTRVLMERIGSGGHRDHASAMAAGIAELAAGWREPPRVVGHRVVHGGTSFVRPTVVDDAVQAEIVALSDLAPLHNPAAAETLAAARRALPAATHVAVFDTAFHSSLPPRAYLYGLPLEMARRGLRRYGFHGTSHDYVAREAARRLGRSLEDLKVVTLHLGNGASGAAVAHGRSIDTSMGLTPLEGLLMGTRSGDVDPGLLLHLLSTGLSVDELGDLLNRGSGLKGMSGVSHDMRDVRAAARAGSEPAMLALEVYAYRIRKLIGAYAAAMGGLDAVVFTGGVGENDAAVRTEALQGLGFLGIELDEERNVMAEAIVSTRTSRVSVLVVRTDEEAVIAEQALEAAGGR